MADFFDKNLSRGNQAVVVGGSSFKSARDVSIFQTVLKLPSIKAPNKFTVPSTHYKYQLSSAEELKATYGRMQGMRAATDAYTTIQMRQDPEKHAIYLWHDTSRVRRERNLNKPFAGEDDIPDIP